MGEGNEREQGVLKGTGYMLIGTRFFGDNRNVPKLSVVMVVQLCEKH